MNSTQVACGIGTALAGIALYTKGMQASGLTAAGICFALPININRIFQQSVSDFTQVYKKEQKVTHKQFVISVISQSLGRMTSGVFIYYGIRGLCPQPSLPRALIVTTLGMLLIGVGSLPHTIKNNPSRLIHEATIPGVILATAAGLKTLGLSK